MEREDLRLTELGLKRQSQIYKDFVKETVGAFKGGTADTLFNFLQGERQTVGDVLKSFTTGINRAISNALSESLFTSLLGGGGMGGFFQNFMNSLTGKKTDDPNKKAQDETNRILIDHNNILMAIRECVCRTASAVEAMAACGCPDNSKITSMNITPGKISTASRLASVFGSIAGAAGALGGMPSGGKSPPSIKIDPKLLGHSGREIPQFPSGGEVPIMAQPGEFIVRKSAAQDNKDLLKSINSGARQSKQAQNVYFINANDAKSFSDMLSSPSARAQLEFQITRAIMGNGQLRDTIKNFGRG